MRDYLSIDTFEGLIFTQIHQSEDELIFTTDDNRKYKMFHSQRCCDSVILHNVAGDLDDLIGEPILIAREDTNAESVYANVKLSVYDESFTWTFYTLATIKGTVVLRWYGSSNGYYSEKADICQLVD